MLKAPFMLDDRWVRWLLAPAIVFLSQAINDAYLVDYWHHLSRGREMTRSGVLLDHDVFTYTVPDRRFIDVNWLTQLAYFQLHQLGGLGLVRTVNALILAGAWAWLVGVCKRESRSLEIAMAVGLAVFAGSWQVLAVRPQTMSILLFIGLYDVLLRAELNPRWLLATPLFLALWANVHGAFPAGLMLIGAFTLAQVISRIGRGAWLPVAFWLLACLAAAAATLVNPYGFEIYEYARQTSGIAARREIDEWLPPSWDQPVGVAFFISLPVVLGLLTWSWKSGRRPSWREIILLVLFGSLSARSIRMVVWWLIVAAPMIAIRLADLFPKSRTIEYPPSRAATATVIVLLAICVLSLPPLHPVNPLIRLRPSDDTTANLDKAYEQIASRAERGNVFTKLEWGEYLGWRGYPDFKVNMDGRIEIYPDDVWQQYRDATVRPVNFVPMAADADFAVLDADFHGRVGALEHLPPNWHEIARFGDVIVLERR